MSGHILHTLFRQNLPPDGGDRPDGGLRAAIDDHFDSFDAFSKRLTSTRTLVQGSGWRCWPGSR